MVVAARYVNRELLLLLVACIGVLLAVTIGGRFISYLQEAALGRFAAASILTILYYRLPGFLQLLLPFGFFLSLLLTLGRLHAEQEFEVLTGGGLSPARLILWLTPLTLMIAVLVAYFSTTLAPDFDQRLTGFIRAERANAEFGVVTPGVFHAYQRNRRVTYAESLSANRKSLEGVFLAELRQGQDAMTLLAERAEQETDPVTGIRRLVLTNGYRYQGSAGAADYQVVSFKRARQRLEDVPIARGTDEVELPMAELLARDDPAAAAEVHWRLALPILVLVGGLLATGLARTKPKQGRFARLLPGLAIFVSYYALLVLSKNAVADGALPRALGMWLVHGAFLALALWLIRSSARPARV